MLDLGPRARVAFAAAWIGGQSALVLTGSRRADHIFAFRMFPEASTLEIHVLRQTRDGIVPTNRGEWSAHDDAGQVRHFSWRDRVRDPVLSHLDTVVFASYGADVQLARLQRALDDVAAHIDGDDETERLMANVVVRRNGDDAVNVTKLSAARPER